MERARKEISAATESGANQTLGGPICQEAAEEQVDTTAWPRGLGQFPITAAKLGRVDRIMTDARLIWEELRVLAQGYR